jgi:hypothetical protein
MSRSIAKGVRANARKDPPFGAAAGSVPERSSSSTRPSLALSSWALNSAVCLRLAFGVWRFAFCVSLHRVCAKADLVEVLQEVGGVLVHAIRACPFQLLLSVSAG